MIGKSIAHFEITAKIGEGGMGEVYQATDTKLNRQVALKVLPESFAQDPQRMGRFQREAQVLASLNHPNIAQIYGLETQDSGPKTAAQSCLVMELVEGEDLSERIARGPIPLEEALPIALQIAEALEDAHEKGIIHRDLKPANIKLTSEGKVKVLDFGLAKALEEERTQEKISNSPTLTMQATQAGVILGTAAYMSPEQAKGKVVDKRTDIWAFGAVLYEMLTGKKAFQGEDLSDTMAAVLRSEVEWPALERPTPVRLSRLVRRCLERDTRQRLQHIGEARIRIEDYLSDPSEDQPVVVASKVTPRPLWQKSLPWTVAGLFCVAFLSTLWFWPSPDPPQPPRRLSVGLGAEVALLGTTPGTSAIVSPDGSLLVFLGKADTSERRQLYLRSLDQLQATVLPGTQDAIQPCFSPDGRWIVFRANGELKKISVTGGAAVTLCAAENSRGVSWGEDGSIVFASGRGGLSRVAAAGGAPEPLTTLAEGDVTHRWPQMLPGGKAVLFTAASTAGRYDDADIVVQRLPDGEKKVLWQGGYQGRYLSSGHLLYAHRGTLFAVPFDLEALEIRGQPVPILEGVWSSSNNGSSQFAFSERGTLVFLPGTFSGFESQLEWLDSEGKRQPFPLEPADIRNFRLSPNGRFLALEISEGQQEDIWLYDIERDTLTRLTFDPADDENPVWSPSSKSLIFSSGREGVDNLYWKRADGSGQPQRLTESQNGQFPVSWHPGGQYVAFVEFTPENRQDLQILALEGDDQSGWTAGESTTFLSTPFIEVSPRFSPDGDWLAYFSNESGMMEVYVRPFPGRGGKWQISSAGGGWPQWSFEGQRLYFGSQEQILFSEYQVNGNSFSANRPTEWYEERFYQRPNTESYALHPNGQRMLVRKQAGEESQLDLDHVVLFENFFDYLKEKAPTNDN